MRIESFGFHGLSLCVVCFHNLPLRQTDTIHGCDCDHLIPGRTPPVPSTLLLGYPNRRSTSSSDRWRSLLSGTLLQGCERLGCRSVGSKTAPCSADG